MNDEDDSYGYGMMGDMSMGDMSMGDMSMGNMTDFGQGGPLDNVNPGERVRNLNPGSRVRDAIGSDDMGDMSQSSSMSIPDTPGPSVLGRTPVLGSVRRGMDMPVLRDNLPDLMD